MTDVQPFRPSLVTIKEADMLSLLRGEVSGISGMVSRIFSLMIGLFTTSDPCSATNLKKRAQAVIRCYSTPSISSEEKQKALQEFKKTFAQRCSKVAPHSKVKESTIMKRYMVAILEGHPEQIKKQVLKAVAPYQSLKIATCATVISGVTALALFYFPQHLRITQMPGGTTLPYPPLSLPDTLNPTPGNISALLIFLAIGGVILHQRRKGSTPAPIDLPEAQKEQQPAPARRSPTPAPAPNVHEERLEQEATRLIEVVNQFVLDNERSIKLNLDNIKNWAELFETLNGLRSLISDRPLLERLQRVNDSLAVFQDQFGELLTGLYQ